MSAMSWQPLGNTRIDGRERYEKDRKFSSSRSSSRRRLWLTLTAACIGSIIAASLYFASSRSRSVATSLSSEMNPLAFSHMILVPCHAVFRGTDLMDVGKESDWSLSDLQLKYKQLPAFLSHIETGMTLLNDDPNTLLIFSGGQTHADVGARSEASSYEMVTKALSQNVPHDRILTEDFARDSFENLMYSLCRFREFTGRYPLNVTVVGLALKQFRFTELHRKALGFPRETFKYVGIDGVVTNDELKKGEFVHAVKPFSSDMYGCRGSLLKKKISRDPMRSSHGIIGYQHVCPEMSELLRFCGNENGSIYDGVLPW